MLSPRHPQSQVQYLSKWHLQLSKGAWCSTKMWISKSKPQFAASNTTATLSKLLSYNNNMLFSNMEFKMYTCQIIVMPVINMVQLTIPARELYKHPKYHCPGNPKEAPASCWKMPHHHSIEKYKGTEDPDPPLPKIFRSIEIQNYCLWHCCKMSQNQCYVTKMLGQFSYDI